jgi:FKBP-type peptidyl-prolyl cis-trans isomerase
MTQKGQRAFALIIAVAFFISTVAFTGLVIWEITRDKQQNGQTALQADENNQVTSQEGQLEGTKLEGFTPVSKVEKLQVQDLNKGNGAEVKADSTITAHYTGALAKDGTIFQSSHDGAGQPFTTQLDGVIRGWQQGLPGMKVGGKRRLIIPAELAYGAQSPSPNIPANSDLVFDIELIAVQ